MIKVAPVNIAVALALSGSVLSGCETLGPDVTGKIRLPEPEVEKVEKRPEEMQFRQLANEEPDEQKIQRLEEYYTGSGVFVGSGAGRAGGGAAPREGKYTLNFDDADLGEVAKVILGDTLNQNYVIDPSVAGRVTLQTSRPLTREELIPTLEMLLRINDTVLVRDGGGYRIEPMAKALKSAGAPRLGGRARALPAGYQIRVIPLQYVGVKEMQEILEPMLPEGSLLRADKGRNLLLVAGTSSELENILETVEIFDVDVMKGMSFGLYPLHNVDPETILGEMDALFGEESGMPVSGMIRFVPIERMNALLVITPQPGYLSEIRRWIERLDRAQTAAGGGVNVYRVQNVDAVELANTLNEIFGKGGAKKERPVSLAPGARPATVSSRTGGGEAETAQKTPSRAQSTTSPSEPSPLLADLEDVRIIADEANNSLVITATAQQYEAIKSVIKQLDVMPLQVLIDATIVEITLKDELEYGVQWLVESGDLTAILSRVSDGQIDSFGPTTGFSTFYTGANVKALLHALANDSKVNVIATPSLMVLNNQEAAINVGDQVPIATSQSTNTSSANVSGDAANAIVTNQIQMVDTGVTLKVKPRVNAGGLVIMEIEQEANQAVETTTSSLNSPTIQQRKINSSVAVHSGETLVLGGLIREQTTKSLDGVPFLSRLPLIGSLFGTTSKLLDKTELVVLITPRVVQNDADARRITHEFKRKLTGIYEEKPDGDMDEESTDSNGEELQGG